ncbi:ABC transporter ATP-binding protein [Bacillus sp. FJAT-45037]|uniref:ABC transporter ATP-binding protein n=1 Tax=Bacillus sp. FJAT-45037 TaxID=2011007 RepID=UPI000C23B7B7|nr:ABC transporter ATP-binding protein [Bacillus sp. FJAT-45037]
MKLRVDKASTDINDQRIVEEISFYVQEGEFVGVIGPNGSGKSTLLKTMYRVLKPSAGNVYLDDEDIQSYTHRNFAKQLAVVGQESSVPFDFSVKDIVLMGRNPHKRFLEQETKDDLKLVEESLLEVGLGGYGKRGFVTLSGGEKQRVLIARAFAQTPNVFLLDEPTNHLDIHHQLHMLDVLKRSSITVLAALHDLNLAASYCDRLIVLKNGKLEMCGTPEETLTEELLLDVFNVKARICRHQLTNKVQIMYVSESMEKDIRLNQVKKWIQS